MDDILDISEVVRRTGLTSRALRFYEARGLVKPLRTHSGRRLYGGAELERIHQVVALKKAGLSLAQIQRLTARAPLDLGKLVEAQLEALAGHARELEEARALLLTIKSHIDQGAPVDVATLCALIRNGDQVMEQDNWKRVLDQHYTSEELAHWADNPPPAGFDQDAYSRQWQDLGDRIEAALPLDPAGTQAQAFVTEWDALLAPFKAVATPQMMAGAQAFWEQADQHRGQVQMPFSAAVMQFIQEARAAGPGEGRPA
jgi:DNA-binding transcriptional MerR regulator